VVGDTFVFGGEVSATRPSPKTRSTFRAPRQGCKSAVLYGGKFPLSTYLAERVRKLLDDRSAWAALPDQVRDWLSLQRDFSKVPGVRELLVETFRAPTALPRLLSLEAGWRTRRSACC